MKRYAKESWVGLFMAAGLCAVVYLAVQLGDVSFWGDDRYPLKALFTSVASLRAGQPVTMMGIDIGRVSAVRIDQQRRRAVVEFEIDKGIEIYSDAIASIRTQGLIGEKYMAIDPGGAGQALAPGGVIIETEPPVDLAEIIAKYAFGSVEEKP